MDDKIENYSMGRRIVLNEQSGKERAGYGEQLINRIAQEVSRDFDINMWHPVSAECTLTEKRVDLRG